MPPSPKISPPAPVIAGNATGLLMSCGCVRWRADDGPVPANCPCGYAGAEVMAEFPIVTA
jgi:hypothetical protein